VLFGAAISGNIKKESVRLSSALLLLFQIGSAGLFLSSNLMVFYVFWNVCFIAMFFMIDLLGSSERGVAASKFLMYGALSSSLMLFGIVLLYYSPIHSLGMQYASSSASSLPESTQMLAFFFIALAFMVSMPLFPLHSWLGDAYAEAPTQGSMLISIMTAFGAFGLITLFSLLPSSTAYSQYLAVIASVSAFYALFLLVRQRDIKRAVAYSKMLTSGLVALGVCSFGIGTYGAACLALSSGLACALLALLADSFFFVFGERDIRLLSGTIVNAKSMAYGFIIGAFALIGMPLASAFAANIALFTGAFQAFGVFALVPMISLIIMAGYLFFVIDKAITGAKISLAIVDYIGTEQRLGYALFIAAMLVLGAFPFLLFSLVK
jgi:NADH:ubiquinone oxidoreductase subunit 4 (subunit M)